MDEFEADKVAFKTGSCEITITPVSSDPNEIDAWVAFKTPSVCGGVSVHYLSAEEFRDSLKSAHEKMGGQAELTGWPDFRMAVSVEADGASALSFECADRDGLKVSFGSTMDQSYIPPLLAQLSGFLRSQAFRLS